VAAGPSGPSGSGVPTPADVTAAARRIAGHTRRTPVLRAEVDGRPLVLKLEQLQRTGSFKFRGALNALLATGGDTEVVTASGGNHGLAVATAAAVLGRPATVYVPATVPAAKASRIEAAGARLVRHGDTYAEAVTAATGHAHERGVPYLPAYEHQLVVAGQGTCAAEAVADEPDVDTVVVAVGGGGLAAGTVLGAGGRPVLAVEPEYSRCLYEALAVGRPVDVQPALAAGSVAASALGASRIGDIPFALLNAPGVWSALVDDQQILAARDRLWEEFRLAVEPAGAVPFAAWLAGLVPGELPLLIVCGANAEWTAS